MYTYIHAYVYAYTRIYIYMRIHIYTCTCLNVYTHIYLCTHIHIYIYSAAGCYSVMQCVAGCCHVLLLLLFGKRHIKNEHKRLRFKNVPINTLSRV